MWAFLTHSNQSDDVFDRLRVQFVRMILLVGAIVGWVDLIFAIGVEKPDDLSRVVVDAIVLTGLAIVFLPLLRYRRFVDGALYATLAGLSLLIVLAPIDVAVISAGAALIIIAALLTTQSVFFLACLIVVGRIAARFIELLDTPDELNSDIILAALILVTLGAIARLFSYTLQRTVNQSKRSNKLLQATAQVSEITSRLLDLDELFNQAVELIRDRFGYYHVQVFLVDENHEFANLVASTGQAGRALLARKHKLAIGSKSVIGRVTQVGEYVIARAGASDGVHARNELLPDTRAELALPIMDGETIIGALDVQSVRVNAFDAADIQALQTMAGQLGVSIRNARLFEEQDKSLQENKRLFFESESNLREIQRLNRQLSGQAWDEYMGSKTNLIGVTLGKDGPTEDVTWTSSMIEASQRQRPVLHRGEMQTIAVPIVLRGQVIGAIELETAPDMREDDAVDMAQSVAGRLAVSLDNARLFEESQEATAQEQRINEIVGKFQSALTVDDLLQITVGELSDMLGAQHGAIRLGSVNKNRGAIETNGHRGDQNNEEHTS
jgi:GAF domain-containing protein